MRHKNSFMVLVIMLPLISSGCKNEKLNESNMVHAKYEIYNDEYESVEKYYFSHLTSDNNRKIYNQIYDALLEQAECIELKISDTDTLEKIFKMVIFDNVDLFYVKSFQYIKKDNFTIKIIPIYYMDSEEIERAEHEIEKYVYKALENVNPDMSAYDKEKNIYDYIVTHTEYDVNSEYNQSIYSVVLGKSVCAGYSFMFKYLCEKVGITCIVITGSSKEGIDHAWNAVCIENNWYMVDCTNATGEKGGITYNFFNVTREQMLRVYNIRNVVKVPECTSIHEEYYFKNDLYFDRVDIEKYRELLQYKHNHGENSLVIRCGSSEVYEEMVKILIKDNELLNMLGYDVSVTCNLESDLLLIDVSWK